MTDDTVLTTWSAAHISGMNFGPPAASVSRSSRNASAELPSVKIEQHDEIADERRGRRCGAAESGAGLQASSAAVRRRPRSSRCAQRSSSTVSAPGIAVSANSRR